ncbi:MAG: DUF1934 domain-containing protein [Eubacteriales bacterium]|nr:DUF1934 domain-containing protein [Eubacteriales bacterium]
MDTKDIILKIKGKQFIGEESEGNVEFVTNGRLYRRNGATYLVYEDSELSGFPGCTTTIRLDGDSIRMKRYGKDAGYDTGMEFRKGKRLTSQYDTPYGSFAMEVMTNGVRNDLSEKGTGFISIDYDLSIEGLAEGRNALEIEVCENPQDAGGQ